MTHRPIHIVLTTIFVPEVLRELKDNLARYGRLDDVQIWVVGDLKTPAAAAVLCAAMDEAGLRVRYMDVAVQGTWGTRFPEFYPRLPFNNETRRNIGFLNALEAGCETLISIDDDNFPTSDDFIGGHMRTGREWDGPIISEPSGFYNLCEHLVLEPDRLVHPRGFPFRLRGGMNANDVHDRHDAVTIGVTAGLWLLEPDLDATTWINGRVLASGFRGPDTSVLAQSTWTPINTQNTSVTRSLIPAFLCVPMGHKVPGGTIERYGDIWGGYILQALMQGTAHHVAFGRPLVEHRRNSHVAVDDLRHEYWGMILTDWLLELLKHEFASGATALVDRVDDLAEFLRSVAAARLPAWAPEEIRQFMHWTAGNLSAWNAACRRIL